LGGGIQVYTKIKGIAPLLGDITEESKNTLIFKKKSSPDPAGQNQLNLEQSIFR
jgi:hypothetical protein